MRFMRVGKQCQFFRDMGVRQISTACLDASVLVIGISTLAAPSPLICP